MAQQKSKADLKLLEEHIRKNYPNVKSLDTRISHKSILSENPKCIITNHGTIAHEYAYFNIPVINTGDNPHINYNFCLHMRNKTQLVNTFLNLKATLIILIFLISRS